MSLKIWKTLHVQKQTRSNVSSHRDTRMGNATVWLTTMQSFVENFAAICFWDYAQQSAMCWAPQHHVATSRCKILFDRLVVKNFLDPASPEANRLSVGNLQIMKCNTLTQRKHCFQTVWCCLPLVLRWALNCKQLLLDFLLGPQWTLSCVTQGLLDLLVMPCEAARKPRQHTQTVCPQEIKGCTQKRLQVSETNILHTTWASSCMSNL